MKAEEQNWVPDPMTKIGAQLVLKHLDGVVWADAPKPSRFHRCSSQTRGWDYSNGQVLIIDRCACGAISLRFRGEKVHWSDRNSRKK